MLDTTRNCFDFFAAHFATEIHSRRDYGGGKGIGNEFWEEYELDPYDDELVLRPAREVLAIALVARKRKRRNGSHLLHLGYSAASADELIDAISPVSAAQAEIEAEYHLRHAATPPPPPPPALPAAGAEITPRIFPRPIQPLTR